MPVTSQYEADLVRLANFRLMDDTFMTQVLSNSPDAVTLILRILLQRSHITVVSVDIQSEYPNLLNHSVRLDVKAVDVHGITYNIEIQNLTKDNPVKRARYYSSMLDTQLLKKGEPYVNLPGTYVIFICEKDLFRMGLPLYHIERHIEELDYARFGDDAHILFVNGQYQDLNHSIGQLMHDFHCRNAADMLLPVLSDRVRHFKETQGGIHHMCRIMEEAFKEVTREKALQIARRMFLEGITVDMIARCTGLPIEDVEALREELLVHA